MKILKDGTWVEFTTRIGTVEFEDLNGRHTVKIETDGEFWRVVSLELPGAGLTPEAARHLARFLTRAADVAEEEEKKLKSLEVLE